MVQVGADDQGYGRDSERRYQAVPWATASSTLYTDEELEAMAAIEFSQLAMAAERADMGAAS